jgi:hypothetical protein
VSDKFQLSLFFDLVLQHEYIHVYVQNWSLFCNIGSLSSLYDAQQYPDEDRRLNLAVESRSINFERFLVLDITPTLTRNFDEMHIS